MRTLLDCSPGKWRLEIMMLQKHPEEVVTDEGDMAQRFQRAQPTRGGTVWQQQMSTNLNQLLS